MGLGKHAFWKVYAEELTYAYVEEGASAPFLLGCHEAKRIYPY
jgi:hypothetical protein